MKIIILSILIVLNLTTVYGQTVKDYFVPAHPANKASFYVPNNTGGHSDISKTIFYKNEGNNIYNILEDTKFDGKSTSIVEITMKLTNVDVKKTKSITTSLFQKNYKESYSPPIIILKMPSVGNTVKWSSMDKGDNIKCTASWENVSKDGIQQKAIKVISEFEGLTTKEAKYYVKGIGLWKTEHLNSDGTTKTFFEFEGLYHDSTIK